jgi:hypothetical protein
VFPSPLTKSGPKSGPFSDFLRRLACSLDAGSVALSEETRAMIRELAEGDGVVLQPHSIAEDST